MITDVICNVVGMMENMLLIYGKVGREEMFAGQLMFADNRPRNSEPVANNDFLHCQNSCGGHGTKTFLPVKISRQKAEHVMCSHNV